MDFHFYETAKGHGLAHDPLNSIVGPRPIGWVSTRGKDGSVNLAPYSFFNILNYTPPLLCFSSTTPKDSVRNCQETGELVWNLPTRALAEAVNATSLPAPYGQDEFGIAGLTKAPSRLVAPPRVAESRVQLECKVTEIHNLKNAEGGFTTAWLVVAQVVAAHVDKALLKDGVFDTFGAGIILRAGGPTAYSEVRPDSRFDLRRPG